MSTLLTALVWGFGTLWASILLLLLVIVSLNWDKASFKLWNGKVAKAPLTKLFVVFWLSLVGTIALILQLPLWLFGRRGFFVQYKRGAWEIKFDIYAFGPKR